MKMFHEKNIIQLFKKYESTMKTAFILTLINNSGLAKDFNMSSIMHTEKKNLNVKPTTQHNPLGPPK